MSKVKQWAEETAEKKVDDIIFKLKDGQIDLETASDLTLKVENVNFEADPNFKILIPTNVPGIDSKILNPRNTWEDKDAYDSKAKELIELFKNNFTKYESFGDYSKAGPD